jgi:hypothetical protein
MSAANVETLRGFWEPLARDGWTVDAWRRGAVDMSLFEPDVAYEDTNLPDHSLGPEEADAVAALRE